MLFAYIDESERGGQFYFLSAIVCSEIQAFTLSMKLHRLMYRYSKMFPFLRPNEEFHGSAIMRAADAPWRHLPSRIKFQIYRDALHLISESNCRIYIEGVDIQAKKARNDNRLTSARELAFGFLLERINECGKEAGVQQVRVIADEHHTSEISRSNFGNYQMFGTPGYRSSTLELVESPLTFQKSQSNRILQAADLVTYIFNRHVTMSDAHPRAVASQEALWKIIQPAAEWPRGRSRVWPQSTNAPLT